MYTILYSQKHWWSLYLVVIIFGGHYIWWYRQKLPFYKVGRLKFNSTQLFDAILSKCNVFDRFTFGCAKIRRQTAKFNSILTLLGHSNNTKSYAVCSRLKGQRTLYKML